MFQIFNFITKNKSFLLFLILELVAFGLIVNTHSFHQSKFLAFSQFYSGKIQNTSSGISRYFNLRQINKTLMEDNTALRNQLELLKNNEGQSEFNPDTTLIYTNARVIKNSFLNANNFLTLDKGSNDGLKTNMGVITHNGLIGVVINTSPNFSKVLSLLNSKSSFNVKLNKSDHFGSLQWNGKDFRTAQLYDIPLQAEVQKGDTISSGAYSLFFPENIPIGTVKDFTIANKMYKVINVELFEDFSAINYVYVVENKNKQEIEQLDQQKIE